MRRTFFTFALLFITAVGNAQSDSLKAAYRKVCTTFRNYEFHSQDVYESHYHGRTKSITLNIENGRFVFSFNDDLSYYGYRHGSKKVSLPIASAMMGLSYYDVHFYVRDSLKMDNGVLCSRPLRVD